ncbi:MAG: hypothetical protein IPJ82_07735 [Lewinellaceae bacterium]|nr:hypothetical protein [Lewinellaceae bacterium]
MDKNLLKTLLAEGKTNQVIEKLKSLLPRLDDDLEKEILLQSGRFEYYLGQQRQGTTSTDEQEPPNQRSFFEIINKIPHEILPEEQAPVTPEYEPGGQPSGQVGPAMNVSSKSYAWASLIAFLIGAVSMALFAIFGRDLVGTGIEGRLLWLGTAAFYSGSAFVRDFFGTDVIKRWNWAALSSELCVGGFYLVLAKVFRITRRPPYRKPQCRRNDYAETQYGLLFTF